MRYNLCKKWSQVAVRKIEKAGAYSVKASAFLQILLERYAYSEISGTFILI